MEGYHRIGLYLREAEDEPLNIIDNGELVIEDDCCDLSQYDCTLDELVRWSQGR